MDSTEPKEERPSPTPRAGRPWLPILLGVLLLGSLLMNALLLMVAAFAGAGTGMSPEFQQVLVDGEAGRTDKIVVIPIQGMILELPDQSGNPSGSVSNLIHQLRALRRDKNVKALVLDIDSPGGGVTSSDIIYHELAAFKKEKNIPVVALFGDVAASGGYYVAMSADHIVAHSTTVTGSIGVISQLYNVHELLDKVGVQVNTIKSLDSQGKESFKDIGSPYRPMTPEERKLIQGLIDEMWQRFTEVVAEGRKGKLSQAQVQQLADGRVFTGPRAKELGLVDTIGYRQDAYRIARDLAQASDAKVVQLQKVPGLQDLLQLGFRSESTNLSDLLGKVDEPAPRLLYLWTGFSR
ncbi:MAG: signal peptide peptidase SppA [Armatimonadetes bacterium]|nr:signal peptide peptidase SppA [Armatimonadota bacterium]